MVRAGRSIVYAAKAYVVRVIPVKRVTEAMPQKILLTSPDALAQTNVCVDADFPADECFDSSALVLSFLAELDRLPTLARRQRTPKEMHLRCLHLLRIRSVLLSFEADIKERRRMVDTVLAQAPEHDKLLAEIGRKPVGHNAGRDVVGSASGEAADEPHRPRRIGLRSCHPWDGRESGGTRRQRRLGRLLSGVDLPQRPCCSEAVRDPDRTSFTYSTISSAKTESCGEIAKPRASATLRLITRLKRVGLCTGNSAGSAPRSIRST
jgi:hypothetical protein